MSLEMNFPDLPKSEIKETLARNLSLAIQNLETQTCDILERFERIVEPKKYLQLALEKLESERLELITAWENWTDTYENTLWDNILQKEFYETHKDSIANEIENYSKKMYQAKCRLNIANGKKFDGGVTDEDIFQAKQRPIGDFIEFNRAQNATCIFHSPDKNPSMHWYKKQNVIKCFSCSEYADAIKVIQKLQGCDFISAVKFLIQK